MDTRTHCLNVLALFLMIYPVAVPSIISNMLYNFIKHDPQKRKDSFWPFSIVNFILIIVLLLIQPDFKGMFTQFDYFKLSFTALLGIATGPVLIILELGIGALIAKLQEKNILKFTVDESIGKEKLWIQISVLLIAVFEELLFRWCAHYVTVSCMNWHNVGFLIFTAVFYAINHIHEGIVTTVQKFVTGLILGTLFLLSGCQILAPILAHVTENLIIIIWSKKTYE